MVKVVTKSAAVATNTSITILVLHALPTVPMLPVTVLPVVTRVVTVPETGIGTAVQEPVKQKPRVMPGITGQARAVRLPTRPVAPVARISTNLTMEIRVALELVCLASRHAPMGKPFLVTAGPRVRLKTLVTPAQGALTTMTMTTIPPA